MPVIYSHQRPTEQLLNWCGSRRVQIDKEIEQLKLEANLMTMIMDKFVADVCNECGGSGHIMKPIPGCECDGPRMHTCDKCKGTGMP